MLYDVEALLRRMMAIEYSALLPGTALLLFYSALLLQTYANTIRVCQGKRSNTKHTPYRYFTTSLLLLLLY